MHPTLAPLESVGRLVSRKTAEVGPNKTLRFSEQHIFSRHSTSNTRYIVNSLNRSTSRYVIVLEYECKAHSFGCEGSVPNHRTTNSEGTEKI